MRVNSAQSLQQIEAFLQETEEMIEKHQNSSSTFFRAFQWPSSAPIFVDRSIRIGNSRTVNQVQGESKKEKEKKPDYRAMFLSAAIGAVYMFLLGRQFACIANETSQKQACEQLDFSVEEDNLKQVIAARIKVHEHNIEDACFYRNLSIAAIAASALAFVGATYSLQGVILFGSVLGFSTLLYGAFQWGMSSVSTDTLASKYESLRRAYIAYQNSLPSAPPIAEHIPTAEAWAL